ncbi:HAD family hydrolase [Catellatospora methionotrophica]|uniref:HAD family hydrolase n=1 Tax=Catellatospora methionotrophica TaxID=121620 RepID=UPI0033C1DD4C
MGVSATPESSRQVRLLATDLDGTLLRSDGTVSARTKTTLRRASRAGMHHVIVTGRPAGRLVELFTELDYRGLAVCAHGAQVYDVGNHAFIHSELLDGRLARAVIDRIAAAVGSLALAADVHGWPGEFVSERSFGDIGPPVLTPHRLVDRAGIWHDAIGKVVLRSEDRTDGELVEVASRCCVPGVSVTHGGPGFVELVPSGWDKAGGLSIVAELLDIEPDEVVAFGDMPTDIPMMRWAGLGAAVSNAHPDALAVADRIVASNDEDGVAQMIDQILNEMTAGSAVE